jgi:diacylglycerol kinase (ATP)
MRYTSVDIIYNPKSTGPSSRYAKDLKHRLERVFPDLTINLQRTKHAGHAVEIAYECAKASKQPLIVSSSGDGGYNEAINGAMRAQEEGARPICAVLAAGNANDHSRTLQNQELFRGIVKGTTKSIDLLKITYRKDGQPESRYAHSYVGLGLTPVVAVELNKTDLNALNEAWIVMKTFYKFRPFKIQRGSKLLTLDSIVFTNIGQMAKILKISKTARPDDGLFEVITFPHSHKLELIKKLATASVTGLEQSKHYKSYKFTVLKEMPIQFDGEVDSIDKHSTVHVKSEHKILRTIL